MDTGFFKWVWRFNALALAGLVGFALVMLLSEASGSLFRDTRAPATVNVDPADDTVEERLELGGASFNEATGLIEMALLRPQTYDRGGFGSGPSKSTYNNTVNPAYMDPETGETHWLLETSEGLIVWEDRVTRGEDENREHVATVFRLVAEDTNRDRRLSASDAGTLYIVDPDGRGVTMLAENVDRASLIGFDAETDILDLTIEETRQLAFVSFRTRRIEKTQPLPAF